MSKVNDAYFASLVWYDNIDKINFLKGLDNTELKNKAYSKHFQYKLPPILKLHNFGSFSLAKSLVNNYFRNNIVLVGDAAHTIHPLAGQGANMGLRDVALLSNLLTKNFDNCRLGGTNVKNITRL